MLSLRTNNNDCLICVVPVGSVWFHLWIYLIFICCFFFFFASAQDRDPCRGEGLLYMQGWVSACVLGFPCLLFYCWRCDDATPFGIVLNAPNSPTSPSAPSFPLYRRKTEIKFFNYEPITVNEKNMHYSRSHWITASNTPLPHSKPSLNPQFNFEVIWLST